MSVQESVVLKGDRQGVSIVIREGTDMSLAILELRKKLAPAQRFFAGAPVRLAAGSRDLQPEEQEALEEAVHEFGLRLVPAGEGVERRSVPVQTASEQEHSPQEETLLVKRTLRSGQRVDFDGNVVILGDVNPGAVVTSSGDIVVMGTLRGVAHAGAQGNARAVVVAFRLEPTQLRIAHLISRAPDGDKCRPSFPEVALVRDDYIQIEAYTP